MANTSHTNTHESIAIDVHEEQHSPNIIAPDAMMLILTWVSFFILLAILNKFALKPILAGLDQREEHIQKSIDDADKIQVEMEALAKKSEQILEEAQSQAKAVIDESRHAAQEAARHIQSKTKEEGRIILENARREIKDEQHKAQAYLRAESARIAIALTEKLIQENLDEKKNEKIIEQALKEIS